MGEAPRHRFTLMAQLQVLVTLLLALGLVAAIGTITVALELRHAQSEISTTLRLAQADSGELSVAFAEQQAYLTTYLVTADPGSLASYRAGTGRIAALEQSLRTRLAGHPVALNGLAATVTALAGWDRGTAQPAISSRAATPVGTTTIATERALGSGTEVAAVQADIVRLHDHVDALVTAALDRVVGTQQTADWVTLGAGLGALTVAAVAVIVLRRSLTGPLHALVTQVRAVADGELHRPVAVEGPPELVLVAGAVETMRTRIMTEMEAAAEAQRRVGVLEEDDRIARDLHDLVIQRLFATGLSLQTVSVRHPEAATALASSIDEIDESIRELRAVIFGLAPRRTMGRGLRDEVLDLAREARRALGFDPHVTFGGPVDAMVPDSVSVEVIPVVREALSNAAKHAAASRLDIDLRVADGTLRLEVADNGRGLPTEGDGTGAGDIGGGGDEDGLAGPRWEGQGLGNLAERAGRLGGTCTIRSDPGHGTTVVWTVPVDDPH